MSAFSQTPLLLLRVVISHRVRAKQAADACM